MITLSITSAGVPWSAADLARITPDPAAPLCSVQTQLEALGYRVLAIQGCGAHVSAEVEPVAVTGETITDEQIRELRKSGAIDWRTFHTAIVNPDQDSKRASRARCAAAMAAAALEHNLRGGGA